MRVWLIIDTFISIFRKIPVYTVLFVFIHHTLTAGP